ncbi:MAG: hypothetical protein GY715_13560, partial [Planctomycetes bacterium]|nr:hypothetical protein [Planctomycetota bacterium]
MRGTFILIGAVAVLSATHVASAQMAKFEWLDEAGSAMDLSPDGRWIVGRSFTTGEGYLWSRETGYNLLGGENAVAVSDDGAVVLGSFEHPTTGHSEAAIWTAAEGWTILGTFPGGTGCPYETSPYELSADGSSAVGLAWNAGGCSGQGFLWTQNGGTQALEFLANGNNRASVISADGSLM